MQTRTLGNSHLEVSAIGLGCMGMSFAYGAPEERDEGESIATDPSRPRAGRDLLRHGRGVRAVHERRAAGPRPEGPPRSRRHRHQVRLPVRRKGRTRGDWTVGRSTSARRWRDRCSGSRRTASTSSTSIGSTARCRSRTWSARWPRSCAKARCAASASRRPASRRSAARTRCIRSRRSRANTRCGSATSSRTSSRCCASSASDSCRSRRSGRGFLTGSVKPAEEYPEGDYRRGDPRYQGENFEANLRAASAVRELAARKQATPARIALAWLLHKGDGHRADPGQQEPKSPRRQHGSGGGLTGCRGHRHARRGAQPRENLRATLQCGAHGPGGPLNEGTASAAVATDAVTPSVLSGPGSVRAAERIACTAAARASLRDRSLGLLVGHRAGDDHVLSRLPVRPASTPCGSP